ncbi:DDB1- and CUL4-associated factor 13 isoform X2 [Rhipicephalus sanguineus]|uniref:DDB1- and CUL4-associated factor 13 isoform X2 n=1 Tax=Rhipicephalus sanguineus TaxID=34632 RepID=UPI0020C2BD09|nr:DDB1- and CUL4-associated factor 13 isoform X2 [Rhipicephalus sanguineus]
MKVKVLSRNPDDYLRETKHDIHKVQRNFDPSLHPFEVCREYTRALNAVKLDKIFARPFLGSLDGHRDGVQVLQKHPRFLAQLFSGACDGEVKVWNLAERKCVRTLQAHQGMVRGITFPGDGQRFITVGDDKNIKTWRAESPSWGEPDEPVHTILTRVNVMASASSDRSIVLYDTRESQPLRRVFLEMRSNTVCWNPMEAFIFTCANEDYNLYTFDMRKLKSAINVHMDHVSAVMDVDYSPTGKEFVSGSYDKTVRIFTTDHGHSREVYHTKRMQRLSCVLWSLDNRYIVTGSDEMNIRLWKAYASQKLGMLSHREQMAFQYQDKLKERFRQHPQVRRIARHRHVPKHIHNAQKEKQAMLASQKRKEANRRAHSRPGTVPYKAERTKHIINEEQ